MIDATGPTCDTSFSMSKGDVIFVRSAGQLQLISRSEFAVEDDLQRLLELHPNLLSGEQLRPGDPVRWLFVKREAGIPDGDSQGDRWSLDHLFLDQDATPTLVEVKRSTDTRIRREVVGQMLDYAANASLRWPRGRIRELALVQYGSEPQLSKALANLLQAAEIEPEREEAYWRSVDDNLAAGRLRLLFVADRIPNELRRIVEFLNAQMSTMEVLGVEIAQYAANGVEAFVPRIVGQTQAALDSKQTQRTQANEQSFIDSLPDEYCAVFEGLLREAEGRELITTWNTKGFSIRMQLGGRPTTLFYGYPPGANGLPHAQMTASSYGLTSERQAMVREHFMHAPFKKSGEYFFTLILEPGKAASAVDAVSSLWKLVEALNPTRSDPGRSARDSQNAS